jgi:hypothetical protein
MLRMQDMAFLDFKFQTFSWGICPHTPWPSAIPILLQYIISQNGPFSKNAPLSHRKILKKTLTSIPKQNY